VVTPIHSDDEVSSGDDHPLQRRRRLPCNDGCPVDGPPLTGHQAPMAVYMPLPGSSIVASLVVALGTSGTVDEVAVASRATAERKVMNAAMAKKATDNAAAGESGHG
jgi:hypothetical protein